ncbi:MAG TPA: hypothetical protein VM050_00960 [Patescibacteria group bacterium]|jgi:hypothetical protein|nr:hypothetical protein [Patescibacteria group bacterium]
MGERHEFETLCGKTITVETDDPERYCEPESLCLLCPQDSCLIYAYYFYEVTHYNNPR